MQGIASRKKANENLKTQQSLFAIIAVVILSLSGCYKPGPGAKQWQTSGLDGGGAYQGTLDAETNRQSTRLPPVIFEPTPTPNAPIILPTQRSSSVEYTVQSGDMLKKIAQMYQVSVDSISQENNLLNPNLIEAGQVLRIPPPSFEDKATSFKIIPDSELVYSASNANFDVNGFVTENRGYLASYKEEVDGITLNGADIVQRVALEYSINPRLLLAFLEYQSGWVTDKNPPPETLNFPLGYFDNYRIGLYSQLAWGANLLNEGYYLWKINAISAWMLSDTTMVMVEPTINPGTAGVLNLLRHLKSKDKWGQATSEVGIFATYYFMFGYPFDLGFEPVISAGLTQPDLQLPFQKDAVWSYTGGPHGGWDTGSAWAALDFAPPGEALGCFPSDAWVVASAPGLIVYSDHGAVIQDLDGDGVWQTGWSLLYMHIDASDRVEAGTFLQAGDHIGHASCEGGFSTGTHLHIARRYNGEWIAADGNLPFVMDGWVASGYGWEYNGYLTKGNVTVEAWNGRSPLNAIQR